MFSRVCAISSVDKNSTLSFQDWKQFLEWVVFSIEASNSGMTCHRRVKITDFDRDLRACGTYRHARANDALKSQLILTGIWSWKNLLRQSSKFVWSLPQSFLNNVTTTLGDSSSSHERGNQRFFNLPSLLRLVRSEPLLLYSLSYEVNNRPTVFLT